MRFVESNLFQMEWPPRSGKVDWFPEMDGAEWLELTTARDKLLAGQLPILDAVDALVRGHAGRCG